MNYTICLRPGRLLIWPEYEDCFDKSYGGHIGSLSFRKTFLLDFCLKSRTLMDNLIGIYFSVLQLYMSISRGESKKGLSTFLRIYT